MTCIDRPGIICTGSLNSFLFLNYWMMRVKDFVFFREKLLFWSVVNRKFVYMTNILHLKRFLSCLKRGFAQIAHGGCRITILGDSQSAPYELGFNLEGG